MKTKIIYLFLFIPIAFFAQQKDITGMVKSESGELIPSASVVVKNSTRGVITDFDGKYSIKASKGDILVFQYIGMVTQEITVGDSNTINVIFEESSENLEEIVVVGYGKQRKSDITGAIASVNSDEIAKTPLLGVADALSGKAAGLQVISNNGSPGSSPTIRIRGVGTLNNSSPIFVVDGLILDDISFLSNNDIESMQVLKDASATAIYGSRGANGVIMVTTKKGKLGKTQIDFRISTGISHVENTIDMVNAKDYGVLRNLAAANAGETDIPYPDPESLGVGVDWWDELYNTAYSQDYSLSMSGKSEKMSYYLSAGYLDQEGIIEKTDYQRINLRLNNEYNLTKHIKVGHNISYIRSHKLNGPDATQAAYRTPAVFEPYDSDGNLQGSENFSNPLVGTFYNNAETELDQLVGNIYGELSIGDFAFRSTYGFDNSNRFARSYSPEYFVSDTQFRDLSNLNKTYNKYKSYIWDNILTYTKELDEHNINIMAGVSAQDTYSESLKGSATDIPDNEDLWYLDATFDPLSRVSENSASSWSYLSYLFRANYSFKNRYLFTGTYRIDGSSKFNKENRYAHFPSLAFGWRVSEESFMENVDPINNLKFRASWGKTGNDKVGAYASKQFLSTTESIGGNESGIVAVLGPNEIPNQGATATRLVDPNIKWESTTQIDVGIELGMFDNRFTTEIDYYNRTTDDILIPIPIPSYFGIREDPTVNAASVRNSGMEFVFSWNDNVGDFNYSISTNLSTLKNEVLELSDRRSYLSGSYESQVLTRTEKGGTIGAFWGYKTAGVFQNQEQIDNNPNSGIEKPGDLIYSDINGDGVITEDDMTYIGTPIPDLLFGLNLSMDYKNFDFSMDINGVQGNDIVNLKAKKRWSSTYDFEQRFVNSWNGEGSTNTHPRVNNADVHNELPNDYWLEDGSYLRIRNVQLGYNFPKSISDKIKSSNIRIYTNVTNLITYTNYSGFTPDVTKSSNVLIAGIDSGIYPLATTYSFGLNVSF